MERISFINVRDFRLSQSDYFNFAFGRQFKPSAVGRARRSRPARHCRRRSSLIAADWLVDQPCRALFDLDVSFVVAAAGVDVVGRDYLWFHSGDSRRFGARPSSHLGRQDDR